MFLSLYLSLFLSLSLSLSLSFSLSTSWTPVSSSTCVSGCGPGAGTFLCTPPIPSTRPLHPSPPDHFVRNCKNRKNFLLNMLCNEITLHVYFWEYINMFCGPVLLWTLEIQVHGGRGGYIQIKC